MPFAPIRPEEAKAVLKEIGGTNINALARELAKRGTPVTVATLREWKKRKWRSSERQIAGQKNIKQQTAAGEMISVAARVGMPEEMLSAMYDSLKALSDGDLVVNATRDLFIYPSLMLAQMRYASDHLLKTNPDSVARIILACLHAVQGGQEMMRESRRLADMSSRNIDPIDVTPKATPSPPPAEQRVVPYANLAAKLRLIGSSSPAAVAEVIPPKANGNGYDH